MSVTDFRLRFPYSIYNKAAVAQDKERDFKNRRGFLEFYNKVIRFKRERKIKVLQ